LHFACNQAIRDENVAPIRKDLAVKRFNLLGADGQSVTLQKNQLVGVFSLEANADGCYLYQHTETTYDFTRVGRESRRNFADRNTKIINGDDDQNRKISESQNTAEQISRKHYRRISEAISFDILSGKGTEAQNNVVCANAAMAIS
jgi:anthranilate phosphoribosyltransferase